MEIKNININKENLKVEVLNYDLKTKLCDEDIECKLGSKKTLQFKLSNLNRIFKCNETSIR